MAGSSARWILEKFVDEYQILTEFNKHLSPHIKHYDSSIYGYAIAEFTPEELTWEVYKINKTVYDKADDGRKISTKRDNRKSPAVYAKYDPNKIQLTINE